MRRYLGVGLLLALSAGVNVLQAYRIYDLRHVISALKGEHQLKVGTRVPPLRVLTNTGKPTEVATSDKRPLVVYWFSPTCTWCARNEANFRAIIRDAGDRFRFVVLTQSISKAEDYDALGRLGITVLGEPDAETNQRLRFGGTPETIVVAGDGKVDRVWSGAYQGRLQREVESYFGVALPGVSPATDTNRPVPQK